MSKGVIIALIVGGFLVVVALIIGYFIWKASKTVSDASTTAGQAAGDALGKSAVQELGKQLVGGLGDLLGIQHN